MDKERAFDLTFESLMKDEGEYSDNPNDSGGETYKGISRKWNPEWEGWKHVDEVTRSPDIQSRSELNECLRKDDVLQSLVRKFYETEYWDKFSFFGENYVCYSKSVNVGVNIGVRTCCRCIQRAINVAGVNHNLFSDRIAEDGIVGPNTKKRLSSIFERLSDSEFASCLSTSFYEYYERWLDSNVYWKQYADAFYRRARWEGIKETSVNTRNPNDKVSENFVWKELYKSATADNLNINNTPAEESVWENLEYLVKTCLQPVRTHFGLPMKINSGYRSPALNKAVGGSTTSFHSIGCAADIEFIGNKVPLKDVFAYIYENLPFTELIAEELPEGWIHVAIQKGRENEKATKYKKFGESVKRGTFDEIMKIF